MNVVIQLGTSRTFGMSREFEDSEHPHQSDDPQHCQGGRGVVTAAPGRRGRRGQSDEVGHDGKQVDDVQKVPEEGQMVGTRNEPKE